MISAGLPLTLLGLCLLHASTVQADQAILIGGGYNVHGSQGQIELNVSWVQDVLKKADVPVITFFTDGDDPAADVHYLYSEAADLEPTALDQLATQLEPVARLFGNQQANLLRYRNHTIEDVKGGTKADGLSQALKDILSSAPDDPTLIVYNGHGKQSHTSTDKVTMELWDDTQMNAAQLHSILDTSNAPTRFVFTQCYSGGFHRLAYANPESGLELSSNTRCGFTAESAYRLAEGCSASVNTNDYRDYTTYFFAALDGYDRHGEILPVDTDTNKDGEISLREAHFYTLENAHSTDLSRSTSEDYLNSWQPWYLKWTANRPNLPNNEYARLFRSLADRHGIALSGNPAKVIRAEIKMYKDTLKSLQSRQHDAENKLYAVQNELIYSAQQQWPSLTDPYTAMFQSMVVSGEMLQVAQWVTEQTGYRNMLELQNEVDNIVASQLDTERNLTQMKKLFHFRKLSKLQQQLYRYGSTEQVSDYEKLVSCEEAPLNFK